MRWLTRLMTTLLILAIVLVGSTLIWNGVPIFAEPGPFSRLYRYLTSNVAETESGHPFPELTPRCYEGVPEDLYRELSAAIRELDWRVVSARPGAYRIDAEVITPLLRFHDDVAVELRPAECGSELWVRSASRVGRADLGANIGHVTRLVTAFESRVGVGGT